LTYKPASRQDLTSTTLIETRLFGHFLLDAIPDEAIPEVFEALGRILEFHRPTPLLPPPPAVRILKGKIVKRYVRPAYSLSEEE
jgi:hypothetical protein